MIYNFDIVNILICTGAAIVLGIAVSFFYMYKSTYNKEFVITLALLPAIVQAVIMLVNGNLGTGVAVMGAFTLVRFRSVPGTAKEIGSIFFAMAVGLAIGTGYIAFALLFTLIIGLSMILLQTLSFGEGKHPRKELKITIPENLDYKGIFDDLFEKYTKESQLVKVKTSNMGSMYKLDYHIVLVGDEIEKEFIDKIRERNGNLDIMCGRLSMNNEGL